MAPNMMVGNKVYRIIPPWKAFPDSRRLTSDF
jgi:hypothetical protein